ncbi:MAG: DUF167 domain-containing protein [Verrucomicrobiota bacterium JB022]|nr:DUF167 domain-containing protein [Verrucomicrobiota bacterium JB022]
MASLSLRVVPNASRSEVVGWMADGALKVKVQAPPEDGKANQQVCAVLAKALGLGKRDVSIVTGEKNRSKTVELTGITLDEVHERLG